MSDPSDNRKYYVVPVMDEEEGVRPDIDVPNWTARYLSPTVALVRDPDGLRDYPILGVQVAVEDALDNLPVELPLSMSQDEANAVCDSLGLARVDIDSLSADRVGGK
jgi:hypothetical protein